MDESTFYRQGYESYPGKIALGDELARRNLDPSDHNEFIDGYLDAVIDYFTGELNKGLKLFGPERCSAAMHELAAVMDKYRPAP